MNFFYRFAIGSLAGIVAIMGFGLTDVAAYDRYSPGCFGCHGDFNSGTYVSFSDGQNWGIDLMNGHMNAFIPGGCDVCHKGGPRGDVALNLSVGEGGLPGIGCIGCHGRAETQAGGAVTGAGLRQHHWRNSVQVCGNAGCHPSDSNPAGFTTVDEIILPPYYASPGGFSTTMPDHSCNLLGFNYSEDRAGAEFGGLDNDGDNVYDTNDPDCASVVPVEDSTWGRIKALFESE